MAKKKLSRQLESVEMVPSPSDQIAEISRAVLVVTKHVKDDQVRIENLVKALTHIQGMAGHPEAAQGCRNIIKRAAEAKDELYNSYKE